MYFLRKYIKMMDAVLEIPYSPKIYFGGNTYNNNVFILIDMIGCYYVST